MEEIYLKDKENNNNMKYSDGASEDRLRQEPTRYNENNNREDEKEDTNKCKLNRPLLKIN